MISMLCLDHRLIDLYFKTRTVTIRSEVKYYRKMTQGVWNVVLVSFIQIYSLKLCKYKLTIHLKRCFMF